MATRLPYTSFNHLVGAGRTDAGTSRPSALAVLRLMTNSYLVGAWRRNKETRLGGLINIIGTWHVADIPASATRRPRGSMKVTWEDSRAP